jgi:hypothetical protein
MRPYLEKTLHKKLLLEWFKIVKHQLSKSEAQSSNPSTAKKTKKQKTKKHNNNKNPDRENEMTTIVWEKIFAKTFI